jgi:hypothetical protein
MDADEPTSLLPLVEGGDVGKANEQRPHLGSVLESLQESHRAVAAAGAEDGAYGRVRESAIQLREPTLIVACQVPMPLENSGVVVNAVAIGNDRKSRVE